MDELRTELADAEEALPYIAELEEEKEQLKQELEALRNKS